MTILALRDVKKPKGYTFVNLTGNISTDYLSFDCPIFIFTCWAQCKGGGGNVTFSVKKIGGSHTRRNFEDNDLIFFLNSQN